ncbi:hypothetical protein JW711_02745 [Candidatus Woesearchaeota archaeon]|nr:hypothetical protein [Candidatus Woesearchaeota archaeon]
MEREKETIVELLKREFPGKRIVVLKDEIICEVKPTSEHPDWSEAIAYIRRSEPHHHQKTTEFYEVERGELSFFVDGVERRLVEGAIGAGGGAVVKPPQAHYAVGDWTRVNVYSEPGWTPEDHLLLKKEDEK